MEPMNHNLRQGDMFRPAWGRKQQETLSALQAGYEAMGAINLQFAESIQEHDLSQLILYETILAGGRD